MTSALQYSTIDEILGPREGRFFSSGYKRIEHSVRDVWFGRDLGTGGSHEERAARGAKISGTASLGYPVDWSTKSRRTLAPHLSTIDALVLAVQLAEASLTYRHRLSPAQRRRLWVSRVSMKAGTSPDEDLAAVPVSARAVRSRPLRDSGRHVTEFSAVVGAMKVDVDIEHDEVFAELRPAFCESLEGILGPREGRYYGRRYTDGDLVLGDVMLDPSHLGLTAQLTMHGAAGPTEAPDGASAAYLPGLTVVDALIAMPQLAQVLMYGLDGLDRAESETLWMRRVSVSAPRPVPAPVGTVTTQGAFTRVGNVRLDGQDWRTAELAGQLHGITASASLAHRLPGNAWSAERDGLVDLRLARHTDPARHTDTDRTPLRLVLPEQDDAATAHRSRAEGTAR